MTPTHVLPTWIVGIFCFWYFIVLLCFFPFVLRIKLLFFQIVSSYVQMDWKNVLRNPLSFWYLYLQIPQHQQNSRQVPPAGVYSGIGLWQCPLPSPDQSATTKGFGHVCRLRFSISGRRMTDKTLQRKRFIEKWANSSEAFLDFIFKSEELEETKKGLEAPTSIGCEGRPVEGNSLKMWEMRRLLAGEKKRLFKVKLFIKDDYTCLWRRTSPKGTPPQPTGLSIWWRFSPDNRAEHCHCLLDIVLFSQR